MTVYVDNLMRPYRRMRMNHLLADSDAELFAMVDRIGVERRHHQAPPQSDSHFDICARKRDLAIAAGAIAVTPRIMAAMRRRRIVTGQLGSPGDALVWFKAHCSSRRAHKAGER